MLILSGQEEILEQAEILAQETGESVTDCHQLKLEASVGHKKQLNLKEGTCTNERG